jgi:hypothetical protein
MTQLVGGGLTLAGGEGALTSPLTGTIRLDRIGAV